MSKKALVKMANILSASGYSTPLILSAIRFPLCISMRQVPPPSQVDPLPSLTIKGFEMNGNMESLTLPGKGFRTKWIKPKIPNSSYVKLDGTITLGFTFSDNTSISLLVSSQLDIPNPPSWPTPSFLHSRYPTPKT